MPASKFSHAERVEAIRRLAEKGLTGTAIAKELGMGYTTVRQVAAQEGIDLLVLRAGRKSNTKSVRLSAEILRLWDAGNDGVSQIALAVGCGDSTVRRVVNAQRPGEIASRANRIVPEKVCTVCGETQPLERFPFRQDRPGVRESRCFPCLRDWRRAYQHQNPDRNREGVRRRRARLRQAQTEPYRDDEIFDRDKGMCWFCKEPVDKSLVWPDPKKMVIHHLHPISKWGPDIKKNVALAHYECNHRAKNKYQPTWDDYVVSELPYADAKRLIEQYHYSHRIGLVSRAFGLFDSENSVVGVVTFGTPPSHRIATSVTDDPGVTVLMLARLWISDETPFGAGSWFLSRALRLLPAAIVVSYADTAIKDTRYGTAHDGGIYRACSFNYAGTTRPNTEWRLPGQQRNVGKNTPGAVQVEVSPKTRYWTVTGTQKQRRALRRKCKWGVLPTSG